MPHLNDVVRAMCLHLPEAEEVVSHGSPEYRVRGKTFARYTINHHGDGKLALILNATPAEQAFAVQSDPRLFFVPAYVGHRGWYAIDLARGLPWPRVAELVREAYARVAPPSLVKHAEPLRKVPKPDSTDLKQIDPFFAPNNQALLEKLRRVCLALPETKEDVAFGMPVFKAGKKTFCQFNCYDGVPAALFWAGPEGQAALTSDPRFAVPAYLGHNGWVRLRLDAGFDAAEVRSLAVQSYRHFALQRMLKALDAGT